jgi:hypothetical protein
MCQKAHDATSQAQFTDSFCILDIVSSFADSSSSFANSALYSFLSFPAEIPASRPGEFITNKSEGQERSIKGRNRKSI